MAEKDNDGPGGWRVSEPPVNCAIYPVASGLGISASSGVSMPSVGGLGFRDVPGAFPHLPTLGKRLQRLLASCPVAVCRRATSLVLHMGQSPPPGRGRWRRFRQSDVTDDYIPREHLELISDWAAALEP